MKFKIGILAVLLCGLLQINGFAQNPMNVLPKIKAHLSFFVGAGISDPLDEQGSSNSSSGSWTEDSSTNVSGSNLLFGVGGYLFLGELVLSIRVEEEMRNFSTLDFDNNSVSLDTNYTSFSFGIGFGESDEIGSYALLVGLQYSIPSQKTVTLNYDSGYSEVLESQDLYSIFAEVVIIAPPFYAAIEGKINLNNPYKSRNSYDSSPDMIVGILSFKLGLTF